MAEITTYGLFELELYRAFHAPQHEVPVPPCSGRGWVSRGEGATIKLWVVVKVGSIAASPLPPADKLVSSRHSVDVPEREARERGKI